MAQFSVTIDHTKVPSTLTNFPVFVDLADMPSGFWTTVASGGGDIRTYASDGVTELCREVVSCDTGTSKGELHIKVPSLSSSTDTVLIIDVDGIRSDYSASATYGRNNVWSNSFVTVHHLQNDPSGSAPQEPDSTGTYDGTSTGTMTSGDLVTGKISKGLDFDGSDDYISLSTSANITGTGARTTSIWCYPASSGNRSMWAMGTSTTSQLWEIMQYGTSLIWHGNGGGMDTLGISAPLATTAWNYVTVSYTGTNIRIYVDGVYKGQLGVTINTGTTLNAIGGPGYFSSWSGLLDEARYSNVARSDDWVTTEYTNQSSPSTFYATAVASSASGQIKVYNGTSFVAKPVKVWNGTAWVVKPLKVWNGTTWVTTNY